MKKKLLLLYLGTSLLTTVVTAQNIKLTSQQEKNWQIKTAIPTASKKLPLGSFMAEVVMPPQHFHAITLPFEAQIKKLYVAQYDYIEKNQLLAEVTGKEWIELQQRLIADAIEFKHHKHLAERKNKLCREGIIAKKECTSANAERQADKIKVSTAKALLRGYGATKTMINNLFAHFKIAQTIPLRSEVSGKLVQLNIRSGNSVSPSDTLFVLQKSGSLWLEADIPVKIARTIKDYQHLSIDFNDETFESTVLLHAPTINVQNQTQKVRFSLPFNPNFLSGLRDNAKILLKKNSLKVAKKSVIDNGEVSVVFLKTTKGYQVHKIEVIAEDESFYFIKDEAILHNPIASTSLAILKGLMEESDE